MEINGSHITGGHLPKPQRVFVAHASMERVHAVATMYELSSTHISKMLNDACNEDNYRRDFWSKTVDGVRFDFHISRFEVELRSFGRHE